MPYGSEFTDFEKGQIFALRNNSISHRTIANPIGRSKTVVTKFLKSPDEYEIKKRTRRTKALTKKEARLVKREASNLVTSYFRIQSSLNLDASRWRIRQISPSRLFQAKKNPSLTEKHKSERLEFGRKYMSWDK